LFRSSYLGSGGSKKGHGGGFFSALRHRGGRGFRRAGRLSTLNFKAQDTGRADRLLPADDEQAMSEIPPELALNFALKSHPEESAR